MTPATHKSIVILMADDDADDRLLARDAFHECQLDRELEFVENGEELMDYLRHHGKYAARPDERLPGLILLDLNMPKMNGLEFLGALRADQTLKDIPAVVVSTSAEKQDMARSFEFGAAAYIIKCFSYPEFRERMRAITPYLAAVQPTETLEPAPL